MDTKTDDRVHFLDSLRGFTLVHMVLFHLCYDLAFFVGLDMPWFKQWPGDVWGGCIRWSFILISGIVFSMGKHPFKRGAVLMGWGCVLTLVTWIAVPDALIRFGVLSFLGAASIIGAAAYPYLKRIPAFYGILCSLILLEVTWQLPDGWLRLASQLRCGLPEALYGTKWLYWLGFPDAGFYSTDYFPIFPWIFLFIIGIYMGELFRNNGIFCWMSRWDPGALAFLGRHSLCIYLIHQPALYGLCLFWENLNIVW